MAPGCLTAVLSMAAGTGTMALAMGRMGEAMSEIPTVYHGTCAERWKSPYRGDLYVTTDLDSAMRYAAEWEKEGEEPLVFRIDGAALAAAGLKLGPNEETVEQYENGAWGDPLGKFACDLTWKDTLALNGTFCIPNFPHEQKVLCTPEEIPAPAPAM